MFIGMDREQLIDTAKWASNGLFDGVQVSYSWKQLERGKDNYDFSIIKEDLNLLQKHGKKLFIQIQDASFSMKWNHTPVYLLKTQRIMGEQTNNISSGIIMKMILRN